MLEEIERQTNLSPAILAESNLQAASDGALDPTFNVSLTEGYGDVFAMTKQADGKILIGGVFSEISGTLRNNLARLNADGTLDESFKVGAGISGGGVYTIVIQPDGKILIGGFFAVYNNTPATRIIRLNADGSVDASFDAGQGFNATVRAIAVQPDGKIWVGGFFTTYNGVDSKRLIRLNADGSIDTAFGGVNNPNGAVTSITIQTDSKILIGGQFTRFNNIQSGRVGVMRLNPDTSVDSSFSSFNNGGLRVNTIAVQSDGKILLGGAFTIYSTKNSCGIVRINNDGTLDTAFPCPLFEVYSILPLSDGKILAIASESGVGKVLRFNADGTVDNTFAAPVSSYSNYIYSIAALPNNQFLIGGSFKTFNNTSQRRLARINGDGTVDSDYSTMAGATGTVYDLAVQSDGKIIVAGDFEFVNGAPAGNIVRLNADGTTDATFNVGSNSNIPISAIALEQDERILVAGLFSSFNNQPSPGLVRLNTDGTLNNSFNNLSFPDYSHLGMLVQPDGKILLAGLYKVQNNYTPVVRLNYDGSLDSSFNVPRFNSEGNALALQSDAKILVGGGFSAIARYNPDATHDTNFGTTVGRSVFDIKIQSDGKILISGSFLSVNNTQQNRIARLNANGSIDSMFSSGSGANSTVMTMFVQPDDKIYIGGYFSSYNDTARYGLARLNQDGTLDTAFDTGSGANNAVRKIVGQTDGKILIGGAFSMFDSVPRNGLVRLLGAAQTGLSLRGRITYGTSSTTKFVSEVLMSVSGASSTATTNSDGVYLLSNLISGTEYTATPSKTGNVNGITPFDATLVLRHVAANGQGPNALNANQQLAADTNNDGSVSPFDATQILRFVAANGANAGTGQTGYWRFSPPSRNYEPLNNSLLDENYEAILVGEISGDWTPPATFASNKESEKAVSLKSNMRRNGDNHEF